MATFQAHNGIASHLFRLACSPRALCILATIVVLVLRSPLVLAAPSGAGDGPTAKDPMDNLWPLIRLIQAWLKPIGIALALWGLLDWGLGNPEGKQRIKVALVMYVGAFLLPYVFDTIGKSFAE